MRHLLKLRSLNSSSGCKYLPSQVSQVQQFSSRPRPSKSSSRLKKTLKNQSESNSIASLFNEITNILGSGSDGLVDKTPSGFFIPREIHARRSIAAAGEERLTRGVSEKHRSREASLTGKCTQGVCENAKEGAEQEKGVSLAAGKTQLGHVGGRTDVSPIVDRMTAIVRAEPNAAPMEDRLESSAFVFDLEVVDGVLKRCFKVPHLGLRFFSWVKLRNDFCHTTRTYNTVMHLAVQAEEFRLIDELLEEMEKNSCQRDVKTWTILMSCHGRTESFSKALFTFEEMRRSGLEPDVSAYQHIIHLQCTASKTEIAMEYYKEAVQKKMVFSMNLYRMLLKCLAKSGDLDSVHSVADNMIGVSQIPEHIVFNSVLKSFCISGRIKESLQLTRDLMKKNMTLDQESFEILIKGLCRADRIADALEIVNIMKIKGIIDGKVYGIIIDGYLKKNDVLKALDIFQSTIESGHLFSASTYTGLMQHLFKLNEYKKGCDLYNDMLARGIEPDCVAITAVVAGHVSHNHIPEAWKAFESMEEKGIKITLSSCFIFIKELCTMSMTDDVLRVLNKMLDSKITIGEEVFHWILSYLKKKGDVGYIERVKRIQRGCSFYLQENETSTGDALPKSNEPEPKELDINICEPCPKAYSDQDLQELCKILSSPMDWSLIQEAMEVCSVKFTPALVTEVLRCHNVSGHAALNFFSWVGKQDSYCHDTETYNMAIKIAGQAKDFRHMRTLFYEMKRKGNLVTSETWTIIIMQYGRTGLTEIALKFFNEMKFICKPSGSTYKYLIMCLCEKKGRKVNEAIKKFREMGRARHVQDKELVQTYLDCLCETGKLSDARECMESLCKVGYGVPLAYSLHIRALCRAGRLEEALALSGEVRTEHYLLLHQHIYGSIVHGLLQQQRLEEALAKIEAMRQLGISPTVHVYTSLIVYFFKDKQVERALEMFKKMRAEGCEPTLVTYSALIRGYMNVAKIDDAWEVFNRLRQKGPCPDFQTYSQFIVSLCGVGESEGALRLLSEMEDGGMFPSTVNYRTVFFGLNREGKHDLARLVMQKKYALKRKRRI